MGVAVHPSNHHTTNIAPGQNQATHRGKTLTGCTSVCNPPRCDPTLAPMGRRPGRKREKDVAPDAAVLRLTIEWRLRMALRRTGPARRQAPGHRSRRPSLVAQALPMPHLPVLFQGIFGRRGPVLPRSPPVLSPRVEIGLDRLHFLQWNLAANWPAVSSARPTDRCYCRSGCLSCPPLTRNRLSKGSRGALLEGIFVWRCWSVRLKKGKTLARGWRVVQVWVETLWASGVFFCVLCFLFSPLAFSLPSLVPAHAGPFPFEPVSCFPSAFSTGLIGPWDFSVASALGLPRPEWPLSH